MAAAKGNQYAAKERIWATAIQRALAKRGGKLGTMGALEELAEKLIQKVEEADVSAIKELGDRLDGKPSQTIDASVSAAVTVEVVKFADTATK